jgi:hypothetical protein
VPSFQDRLKKVMATGNLTVADLARWFDRPHPTVNGWVRDGGNVGGATLDVAYVYAQLDKLERMIRKKQGFPVPRMPRQKRIGYLAEIGQCGKSSPAS